MNLISSKQNEWTVWRRSLTILCLLLVVLVPAAGVRAATILYVPFDDRPVSLAGVVETARAAGMEVEAPPVELLASRYRQGNPEALWQWVEEHAGTADAMVVSTDALVYGGLVASRTHEIPAAVLTERVAKFTALQARYPALRLYGFSTIMRSPHASSGGVEPPYYEQYGPAMFRLTSLEDKAEFAGLTPAEQQEMQQLRQLIPASALEDWLNRRVKNFKVNEELVQGVRQDVFRYLLMGRDDCSPLSRSHQESRWLSKLTADLSASRYLSFPGADQLGMIMMTRAIHDITMQMPSVKVVYGDGVGAQTIASYEDTPVGQNVRDHLLAAGCLPLVYSEKADVLLLVNTPVDGWTREAGRPDNTAVPHPSVVKLAERMQAAIRQGQAVAVADVAFANGADNALLQAMQQHGSLNDLAAYSGWNTAGNTIGYTIGQGVLASRMTAAERQHLLAVRLVDDWGYQANVRPQLLQTVLAPQHISDVQLDQKRPQVAAAATKALQEFMAKQPGTAFLPEFRVDFPWNRMFEVEVQLKQ